MTGDNRSVAAPKPGLAGVGPHASHSVPPAVAAMFDGFVEHEGASAMALYAAARYHADVTKNTFLEVSRLVALGDSERGDGGRSVWRVLLWLQ